MLIGYARVSTVDQDLVLQLDALTARTPACCTRSKLTFIDYQDPDILPSEVVRNLVEV